MKILMIVFSIINIHRKLYFKCFKSTTENKIKFNMFIKIFPQNKQPSSMASLLTSFADSKIGSKPLKIFNNNSSFKYIGGKI